MIRPKIDLLRLQPEDLPGLSDVEFRDAVNADLRRRVRPGVLPDEVSDALRTPAFVERWRSTLEGILRSVEGQLAARQSEFDADMLTMTGPDRKIREADYLRWMTGTTRFKSGVEEHLVLATSLCEARRDAMFDTEVARDRDRLSQRVDALEGAIRAHRTAVMATFGEGEVADEIDTALWRSLGGRHGR